MISRAAHCALAFVGPHMLTVAVHCALFCIGPHNANRALNASHTLGLDLVDPCTGIGVHDHCQLVRMRFQVLAQVGILRELMPNAFEVALIKTGL